MINVWTNEQKNTKPKNRQLTPFDEQPSTSRISRHNGLGGLLDRGERDTEYSQGKYTQNQTANLPHTFSNLHLGEPSNVHQSSVEPMRRISTQSHTSIASFQNPALHQNHQNSHGNYVDIDAIDSILSENENFHFDRAAQYERNVNQSLMDVTNVSSPIYENQTSLIRSDSPIYSNTHNQSIASLYPKAQNIYSNLPAITAGPSNAAQQIENYGPAAYANIQPQHHALTQSELIKMFNMQLD